MDPYAPHLRTPSNVSHQDFYQDSCKTPTKEKEPFLRRRRITPKGGTLPQTKLSLCNRKAFNIKTFSSKREE